MTRILPLILVLAAWLPPAGAEVVRFATFNTWWLFDDDAPHLNWSARRAGQPYAEKLDRVAGAIAAVDADVVGLQEVEGPAVVADLVAALRTRGVDYPHHWVGQGTDPFTGQDVALLSRYPALTEPVLRYPGLTEPYFDEHGGHPRLAALPKLMRVDLEVRGEAVTVFVAHLKSQIGDEAAQEERLAQSRALRRLVRAVAEKGRPKVVLMGDMNDDNGSATLLTLRGLTDGSYPMDQPSSRLPAANRWTHDHHGQREQLDHILLSRFLSQRLRAVRVARFGDAVSDHDAFVVDFDFD